MEVILKENFPSLGYVGDQVKVRAGYARNFLIPRGIALEASSRNAKELAHRMQGVIASKIKLKAQAEEIAKRLAAVSLEYTLKAGESGKLYGSVHAKDIEASLAAQGFIVSKTQIRLAEAIRKGGDYKATIKLHSEVSVDVPVKVLTDVIKSKESSDEADADGSRAKKKAKGGRKAKAEGEAEGETEGEAPPTEGVEVAAEAAPVKPKKERKKREPKEGEASAKSDQVKDEAKA